VKRPGGAVAVSGGILLSRIAGLLREAVVRGRLGLGVAGSAYSAALRVPNLLQNLLGEGVLSGSFIPVYSAMVDEDPKAGGRLAGAVASFLFLVTTGLVVLGVVFADAIGSVLLVGVGDETTDLAVELIRIMTPGVGLLVLSAWSLGVLNSHRKFFLAYASPVLWNATQIIVVSAAAVGVVDRDVAVRVAWAVTVGAGLQFLVQLPAVRRANAYIRPNLEFGTPAFHDFLRRLGPVILGRGSAQISAFVDLVLAGLLAISAIGALAAAQVLYLLPISLFAMSVAAAELPELSRENDHLALERRLSSGLIRIGFFVSFTSVVYLFAGTRVVAAVYSIVPRSTFGSDDIFVVALVLGGYTLGLMAVATSRLIQNVFYALGDTATPAGAAIYRFSISAVVAIAVMFQFEQLFVYDGVITGFDRLLAPLQPLSQSIRDSSNAPLRLGAVGLALGAAIGAWTEFWLLRRRLIERLGRRSLTNGNWKSLVLPTAVSGLLLLLLLPVTRWAPAGVDLMLSAGPAGILYIWVSHRQGIEEATKMVRFFSRPTT
jgi:putative peptidoglycan lipid II flippase